MSCRAMRTWLATGVAAAVAVAVGSGCGESSKQASGPAPQPTTTEAASAPTPSPKPRVAGPVHRSHGVAIRLPRGYLAARRPAKAGDWPVPRTVVSSFPVRRTSGNALCPPDVIASMPPDGIYIVVAEYTKPRPRDIPAGTRPGPRGDLRHLNIRPSEVECWEGPGGSASFTERGRAFHVELLLGKRVSAAQRRRALEALASLRVTG
jgi:hypothetical protein